MTQHFQPPGFNNLGFLLKNEFTERLLHYSQEEAIANIQAIVELYYHGENVSEPPAPSQMEELLNSYFYTRDSFLYLADINFSFLAPKTQRINITVPKYKLVKIDRAAKQKGVSRSAFFVSSAEQQISRSSQTT